MTGFFTAIALATIVTIIPIHYNYDSWCCNGEDCKPKPCKELVVNDDGSVTWNGHVAPKDRVYPSEDGHCHFCVYNGVLGPRRCAYLPAQS